MRFLTLKICQKWLWIILLTFNSDFWWKFNEKLSKSGILTILQGHTKVKIVKKISASLRTLTLAWKGKESRSLQQIWWRHRNEMFVDAEYDIEIWEYVCVVEIEISSRRVYYNEIFSLINLHRSLRNSKMWKKLNNKKKKLKKKIKNCERKLKEEKKILARSLIWVKKKRKK